MHGLRVISKKVLLPGRLSGTETENKKGGQSAAFRIKATFPEIVDFSSSLTGTQKCFIIR